MVIEFALALLTALTLAGNPPLAGDRDQLLLDVLKGVVNYLLRKGQGSRPGFWEITWKRLATM